MIYKFSKNPGGQKGMIIRFEPLDIEQKKLLKKFMQGEMQDVIPEKDITRPSVSISMQAAEKTIITSLDSLEPVSYTHLTLPTICSV